MYNTHENIVIPKISLNAIERVLNRLILKFDEVVRKRSIEVKTRYN